jgi:hypothetical protein
MNLEETILNYGIAGMILLVFYKIFTNIFTNELNELKRAIERLSEAIEKNNLLITELINELKKR